MSNSQPSTYDVSLQEAIYSLSDALDLVGVTHIHHGKRVAYIAAECGKLLGWSGARLDDLFQAAVLHDCGVSRTIIHSRLAQLQWEYENEHCEVGAAMLSACPLLARFSDMVRYHHTHWANLQEVDVSEETKLAANCIYLADRVDILTLASMKDNANVLLGVDATRRRVLERRESWFHPDLADAFLELADSETFWMRLEGERVNSYAAKWMSERKDGSVDFENLRSLVQVFAVIVDAKSPYTRKHSDAVARLSRFLGERMGLARRSCELLELAGLLHDLGKLRIPDEYLEKPGKLTAEEYAVVQRHSFDTYNILKNIRGFEEVALWAAQHHERVDGSGYPHRLTRPQLSLEARIIAVADVFQALEQRRPYRGPMAPDQILTVLRDEAANKKLDHEVIEVVAAYLDECWRIAFID